MLLLEIRAQRARLGIVEVGAAWLCHHDERAMRQRVLIGERNSDVVEAAVRGAADRCPRQLREAKREVLVGARPVDEPAVAVAVRRVAEDDATERPRPVIARILADARARAEASGATALELRSAAKVSSATSNSSEWGS